MLKKVITAKLNTEDLIDPVEIDNLDILKKAELLEQVQATKEEKVNDNQAKSEPTN